MLTLLLLVDAAAAESASEVSHWEHLSLDGRKVGHSELRLRSDGDHHYRDYRAELQLIDQEHSERLQIELWEVESLGGDPIKLRWQISAGRRIEKVNAWLKDGHLRGVHQIGTRRQPFDLPASAELVFGEGLALRVGELLSGQQQTVTIAWFQPARRVISRWQLSSRLLSGEAHADPDLVSLQARNLDSGREQLWQWHRRSRRLLTPMQIAGQAVSMTAVSRDQALAANDPVDIVQDLTLSSPFRISERALGGRIRYLLQRRDGLPLGLPEGAEQQVVVRGKRSVVTVCAACSSQTREPEPSESYRQATRWIESDERQIRRLAGRGARRDESRDRTMRRLVRLVQKQLGESVDYLGYASAAEAIEQRSGDCTEYALLLAALARARQIPARVVAGIAYASRFTGGGPEFGPHMWVQVWDQGRWRSYDAGFGRFDAGHIVLAHGDGSPQAYAEVAALIRQLEIVDAGQLPELTSTQQP